MFVPGVLFWDKSSKTKKLGILFLTRLKKTPLLLSINTSLVEQIPLQIMVRHSQVFLLFFDDSQSIAVLLLAIREPRRRAPWKRRYSDSLVGATRCHPAAHVILRFRAILLSRGWPVRDREPRLQIMRTWLVLPEEWNLCGQPLWPTVGTNKWPRWTSSGVSSISWLVPVLAPTVLKKFLENFKEKSNVADPWNFGTDRNRITLTNRSGCGSTSCYFSQWPSRRQQKKFS